MRLFLKNHCLQTVTGVRFLKIAYIVDARGEFCIVFLQLSTRVLGQSFSSLILFFLVYGLICQFVITPFSRIAL